MTGLVFQWTRALCLFLCLSPFAAGADWIRDELYLILRDGPGLDNAKLETLSSGDQVRVLKTDGEWANVKTKDGLAGGVPSKYLEKTLPAVLALPKAHSDLEKARSKITELDDKLALQTEQLEELETIRARANELEADHAAIARSDRVLTLIAGGGIIVVGMLIGAVLPRGRSDKSRRLRF